jgi:aminoglycoside/choline kinase family phosphotransferase
MNNIKKVAKYLVANPDTDEAKALLELAVALETNAPYKLHQLYEVDREAFKLGLGLIEDWRLDRHYLSKLRLLDHAEINQVPVFQ